MTFDYSSSSDAFTVRGRFCHLTTMRPKNSRLFEIASVLVCVDHVVRFIINADHGVA